MNCTREYVNIGDTEHYAHKITDVDTGKYVYVPTKEAFNYIRFRIVNRGDRLADAYEKAGSIYKSIIPPANLIPAFKLLYTNFEIINDQGARVFQDYGPWVFEEACMILKGTDEEGRIDLGDGFIVPSPEERVCIYNAFFNQGKTLKRAMFGCCPDIIYPESAYALIEKQITDSSKHYQFFDAVRNAHTGIVGPTRGGRIILDNLVIPSESELFDLGNAIFNLGMTLSEAYSRICSDITPSIDKITCIESKIFRMGELNMSWSDIYRSCAVKETKNILLYGIIAGLGLILIAER
jgi:hypothetical protein